MKPTIPSLVSRLAAYHVQHPSWGCLHIVMADTNVKDGDVTWCIERARTTHDDEGEAIATTLLEMSTTQRRKLSRTLGAFYRQEPSQ